MPNWQVPGMPVCGAFIVYTMEAATLFNKFQEAEE